MILTLLNLGQLQKDLRERTKMVVKHIDDRSLDTLQTFDELNDFVEMVDYLSEMATIEELTRAEDLLFQKILKKNEPMIDDIEPVGEEKKHEKIW
jgi:hypothetical protein